MKIQVNSGTLKGRPTGVHILLVVEGENPVDQCHPSLAGPLASLLACGDFKGAAGQVNTLYPAQPGPRLILAGLGPSGKLASSCIRRAMAQAIRAARETATHELTLQLPRCLPAALSAEAACEGALLGGYRFHRFDVPGYNPESPPGLEVLVDSDQDIDAAREGTGIGSAIAAAACLARDLVNTPANYCTPAHLAEAAAAIPGLRTVVLERSDMESLGMGSLLGVAQGSETPPKFIIMEHNADRADSLDTLVLAGKGITFDTGGYSMKSVTGMVGMKSDMGGGAAVIGAMQAVAALQPELHVVGLVPAVDNLVSAQAIRPQDVLVASNGLSIEIISTDAEGRLILADALVYAGRYEPAAVIDIATLTGSCVTALGSAAAGLFSNHDGLRDDLLAAASRSEERLWPLPLFPDYDKALESQVADLRNSAAPSTGVGTSAAFLQRFTTCPAWAHLDIAGVVGIEGLGSIDRSDPLLPEKGATGFGARLFVDLVRHWRSPA
ncbi:MAG: leucyl aminopeptidase [Anaerolineaceae bacterium]|nr:leucyl aminopeptidase [Anaerolineaceae bacterium]